jgi:Biotin-lipoyl like
MDGSSRSARSVEVIAHEHVDDNQYVIEGQILVILDPNDYKVGLDQDAITTAFLDGLCRKDVREGEISRVLAIAGVPESVFYEQFHSKKISSRHF